MNLRPIHDSLYSRMRVCVPVLVLSLMGGTSVMMVEGVVRKDDLLARWTFDEGNGTSAANVAGENIDATLRGAAQWGTGISRNALDLTGNSGWVEAGPHANLKAGKDHSIAIWFKSTQAQYDWTQLLAKRQDTFSPYFIQFDPGSCLQHVGHALLKRDTELGMMHCTYWTQQQVVINRERWSRVHD